MKRLLLALVAAAFGVAPQAAAADAPWSAPVNVGPPSDYVMSPALAFAPSGAGFASWLVRAQPAGADGLPGAVSVKAGPDNDGIGGRLATLGASGGPSRLVRTHDTIAAGPALDAGGRGVVLRTLVLGSDPSGYRKVRLSWSAVGRGGTLGKLHRLATATLVTPPSVAVDARGDALAAWVEYVAPPLHHGNVYYGYGTNRVVAAWRPAGGGFGRPAVLLRTQYVDSEHGGTVHVAMSRSGRAVVAYDDARETRHGERRHVLAWTRTPRSRFSRTLVAGPHDGFADLAAVVTSTGRAVLVWGSQDGGEEANRPWIVRAASLAPGAHRFSRVQVLDPGGGVNRPWGDVVAAAGPAGTVLAAWSGVRVGTSGRLFPVETATSAANGVFGAVQTLAPMGAVGGAAVRGDGTQIVTWARMLGYQLTDQATAALRPAGQPSFAAPEPIAAPDHALPPAVAFDPRTGAPVVAWPARPNGTDPSEGIGTTAILRIARRAAP